MNAMIDRACISLTNKCNLKCKYCHFQDKQNNYSEFSIDDLKTIVDNIHDYCKQNHLEKFKLGIVGSGEPMLKFSTIIEILNHIVENKYNEFNIYTITNGTLLNERKIEELYKYKDLIKVCFSLDGYKELHNVGRMLYDNTALAINTYYLIFGEMPSINATVNLLSYQNKEKLIEFFQKHNLYDVTFSKLVGYFEKDLYISDEQFKDFMDYAESKGMKSRQFRKEKCYDCTMYGRLCGVGRTNIFITPEGIYPCGRFYKNDKYLLGSFDSNLFEVEKNVNQMKPVEDGKCYYIENVEGRNE